MSKGPKLGAGQGRARAMPEQGGGRTRWKRKRFQLVNERQRNVRPKLCAWLEGNETMVGGTRLRWGGICTKGRASHRVQVRVRIPGFFGGTFQKSSAKG